MKPVSVTQLNNYIGRILASDPIVNNIAVRGEVSNLTKHSSGHWYFNLKDANSKINCFLASGRVNSLQFNLAEGMQIIAYGAVSVYEKGGYYSLNIKAVEADGEGALSLAYEKLKKQLEAEGLFDEDHKRPIPSFPRKIGVVTSPTGAAIKDIITTLKRRSNLVDLILYPCLVQGADAAESIAQGIKYLNEHNKDLDLLIVGRGGGSIEDLWAFNEEAVARAIYNSQIPVISAVGHERDYVISDYVADLRAATPTAAAELAVPHIDLFKDMLYRYSPVKMFGIIEEQISNGELKIKHLKTTIDASVDEKIASLEHKLQMLKLSLDSLNPLNVLDKGYAAVKLDGKWLLNASGLNQGDKIDIIFNDGKANCTVNNVEVKNG